MERWTDDMGDRAHHAALSCTIESEYPVAVIRLCGCLGADETPDVHACVRGCLAAEPDAIVLDVADLSMATDECANVFPLISAQAMTWPGSTVVFASASPALLAAVRREGADIASYPSVEAARHQADPGGPRYRLREALPRSPIAAPVARRVLGRACRSWSVLELLEPAELVATELVANAVRQAGSRIVLTVSLRGGQLQISVGDDSPAVPRQRTAGAADEHGRGLLMVDALCQDWGMTCVGDGKVVWAKVAAVPREPEAA
jgi:anti-sigma regulatory factor (Ser/Thr protein kinase)